MYDIYKNIEKNSFNIVGDWFLFDFLVQREYRIRMLKVGLKEFNLEFGINDNMNEIFLYTVREVCWGISFEELKILGSVFLGGFEMLFSEMICEDKICLSEKIYGSYILFFIFIDSTLIIFGTVGLQILVEF